MKRIVLTVIAIVSIAVLTLLWQASGMKKRGPEGGAGSQSDSDSKGQKDEVLLKQDRLASIEIPEPVTELQKAIAGKQAEDTTRLPRQIFSMVTEADYPFMKAILTHKDKKHVWGYAIKAMGFIGTEQTVDDLLGLLSADNTELVASSSGCILYALGFAAHTNDRAYEFLKQGCDPEFWEERMKNWKMPEGSSIEKETMIAVNVAVQAIGMSGREGAREYIYDLAKTASYLTYKTSIASALFYLDLIRENSWKTFKHDIYPNYIELCHQWLKSHPEWDNWTIGGPLPPLKESMKEPQP